VTTPQFEEPDNQTRPHPTIIEITVSADPFAELKGKGAQPPQSDTTFPAFRIDHSVGTASGGTHLPEMRVSGDYRFRRTAGPVISGRTRRWTIQQDAIPKPGPRGGDGRDATRIAQQVGKKRNW
jgi:hypothetical protein